MFTRAITLTEFSASRKCYICTTKTGFPMGLEGKSDCGMRRKRWVWKAWLEAFVTSWLQWSSPWSIGVTVSTALWRNMFVVALAPSLNTLHVWSSSVMLFRYHLIHMRPEAKSTILTVELCVLQIVQEFWRLVRTSKQPRAALGLDLCRCPRRERFDSPDMTWCGSETLNLWCLFIGDYRCVSGFSIFYAEI